MSQDCFEGEPKGPRPRDFSVLLDGVPATPNITDWGTFFSWEHFPEDAALLEVSYESSSAGCLALKLELLDESCEIDNPPPECDL